jgi:hypothetical protein
MPNSNLRLSAQCPGAAGAAAKLARRVLSSVLDIMVSIRDFILQHAAGRFPVADRLDGPDSLHAREMSVARTAIMSGDFFNV